MKRSVFNVITAILAVTYIVCLVLGNVFYSAIPVATLPGSYAEKFAEEKMLHKIDVPDSEKRFLDFRYENFDYNTTDKDTLCIERYKGLSRDLMIPGFIGGKMVTSIGENFFEGLDVDCLYIPETIVEILADPTDKVTLYCDKDSPFYEYNKDSDEWRIETAYDSTYYNPLCADIPFSYNDNGNSIELVGYKGNDSIIAIPSYIDGKPVTTVSFDLLGRYDMVIFPDTVKEINGKVGVWVYSPVFIVEVLFTVLAFVSAIVVINIIYSRLSKNLGEYMLSGPQAIVSILFLIVQIVFCFISIYLIPISAGLAFVLSFLLVMSYMVFVFLLNRGREHSLQITEKISDQTAPVRNLQSMVRGLHDGIEDPEIKKYVSRVVDEIKYTQAKSRNTGIERLVADEIALLKDAISKGNKDRIIHKCDEIIDLMKSRF